jgi:hypothetical protein
MRVAYLLKDLDACVRTVLKLFTDQRDVRLVVVELPDDFLRGSS